MPLVTKTPSQLADAADFNGADDFVIGRGAGPALRGKLTALKSWLDANGPAGGAVTGAIAARDEAEVARVASQAAAAQSLSQYQDMLAIQALGNDAAAIAARAKLDGSNFTGGQPALFRAAIGAVGTLLDHKGRSIVPPGLLGRRSDGLKLRRGLSDIRAGTITALRGMGYGDSLMGISWSTFTVQLMKELEGHFRSAPVYAHSIGVLDYGTASDASAASTTAKFCTGTYREKLDFDAAPDGTLVWLDAGQAVNFSIGGLAVKADRLYIPIITEAGAGTVKIELSSDATPPALAGAYVNPTAPQIVSAHALTGVELLVNANGAFGVSIPILSLPLGPWTVKVSHVSGGRVRVRHPMHEVRTASAFNVWRVGTASNDFANTLASSATIEAGQIATYDPHFITVDCDDSLASMQNFLPKLEAAIAASGLAHKPQVILVVPPFYNNPPYTDARAIEKAQYFHDFVATRINWSVADGMAMSGGLAEATAAGWNNDGIHYNGEIARWMARTWLAERGMLPTDGRAGGAASNAVALLGPTTTSKGSARPLTAGAVPALLLQSSAFDTGICGWSFTAAGSASYARGNAGDIDLATGATANSGVGAFINQSGSLMGASQNNIRGESRGFAIRVRTTTAWDAQTQAHILIRSNDSAWNSGYNGPLTGQGWGFRITYDGANAIIQGVCWNNGALVVSAGSAILPTGAVSSVKDLAILLNPGSVNVTKGECEWFVGEASLGTGTYEHGAVFLGGPRVEFSNGGTAANRAFSFMPGKLLSAPQ